MSESENDDDFFLKERYSVQDLHYNNMLKDLEIKKVYEKVTDQCFSRITRANEQLGRDYTDFLVPYSVMGSKGYDFTECVCHIIFTLRKAGFYVRYVYPNRIFVCWPNYEKIEEAKQKIKFLKYESEKTNELIQKDGNIRPRVKNEHQQLQHNPHLIKGMDPAHVAKETKYLTLPED